MRFGMIFTFLLISVQIVSSESHRFPSEHFKVRIKKYVDHIRQEDSASPFPRTADDIFGPTLDPGCNGTHSDGHKSDDDFIEDYDETTQGTQFGIFKNSSYNNDTSLPTPTTEQQPLQRVELEVSRYYCEAEEFHHAYITADEVSRPTTNVWKRARVGERATTRDLCLLPNGLPLTRACLFNSAQDSAEWEQITRKNISCLRWTRQRIATFDLSRLHEEVTGVSVMQRGAAGRSQVLRKVATILQNSDQMLPADVHYLAAIMRSTIRGIRGDPQLTRDVLGLCSHLMAQDLEVLRLSGEVNATNLVLETFEHFMDDQAGTAVRGAPPSESSFDGGNDDIPTGSQTHSVPHIETVSYPLQGVRAHLSANLSVFFVDPEFAQITGIAVYDPATASNITHELYGEARGDFVYRFIRSNESSSEMLKETGLLVASFVPRTLWANVRKKLLARGRKPQIVLKVYATDCLFVEQGEHLDRKPRGKVLSISIPGHRGPFEEHLPFLIRNEYFGSHPQSAQAYSNGTGCGYWNYTTWLSDSDIQSPSNAQHLPVILCGSLHLTQFSFLMGGSFRQGNPSGDVLITPLQQRALDVISLLGCSLSLLGLLGIWLTAAFFRSWRTLASNKLLLNLCFVLTLQLVLFLFVNTNDLTQDLLEQQDIVACVVLGALMQYTVLVLFSWMLIMAFLQFQRYVTVIGIERPKHYILKSAVAAWGFPLIPTLLAVFTDTQAYVPSEYQILHTDAVCYPSGHALTFGVVLPITLITVANLYVFARVFYSISRSLKHVERRSERRMIEKQIRLSVLLFFLFGLSWIFGVFAYMQAGIVFSYLFCLTATLQGFVLFVYFVVLDVGARRLWQNLLFGEASTAKKRATEKRSRELQSMTLTSGLDEQGTKE